MEIFVHVSLALSILLSVVAAHPGHSLQHGADHIHPPRQERGAPFVGIKMLSESGIMDPNTPTFPTVTQPTQSTTQSSGSTNRPTGPTTYLPVGTGSIGPFPITKFAVAIATICSSGLNPTSNATNRSAPITNNSAVLSPGLYDAKMVSELPAAATAPMRVSSSERHNITAPIPTFTAYDGLGCSTLYTLTSSAIYDTLLKGLGALPIRVTDCQQSVTFSTSTGREPVPTAVMLNNTTTNTIAAQGESVQDRLAYFVAPWYDLVDGQLPTRVVVQNCMQGMEEEACTTVTESWRMVNQTSSVEIKGNLAFEGQVTGPATVTLGRGLFTTTVAESTTTLLSIQTNATLTIPTYVPSLSRSVIGANVPPPQVVTSMPASSPTTTQIFLVEAVTNITSTVYKTLTSTIKRTVTAGS